MITATQVQEIVLAFLADKDYELITCTCSPSGEILVEVDSYNGVDVDFCAELSRYLQAELDSRFPADSENYSLEVGSVSLTDPFKTLMQYKKNLGNPVEILTKEGKKLHGELVNVEDDFFEADCEVMVEVELKTGRKKKQKGIETLRFAYSDVKRCCYELKV